MAIIIFRVKPLYHIYFFLSMEIEKIGFDELQNKDIFKLKFEASD